MDIVDAKSVNLSNFEVLSFLKEEKNDLTKNQKKKKNKDKLLTLIVETINYLEPTPAGKQEEGTLQECIEELQRLCQEENFLLTKDEFLQLVNLRPKTAVEIQLLIENSEERLTEAQVDRLLDTISEKLPGDEEEEEEEGEGEVEATVNENEQVEEESQPAEQDNWERKVSTENILFQGWGSWPGLSERSGSVFKAGVVLNTSKNPDPPPPF